MHFLEEENSLVYFQKVREVVQHLNLGVPFHMTKVLSSNIFWLEPVVNVLSENIHFV